MYAPSGPYYQGVLTLHQLLSLPAAILQAAPPQAVRAQARLLTALHLQLHVFLPRHLPLRHLQMLTIVYLLLRQQMMTPVDLLHLLQMLTVVHLLHPPHPLLLLQALTSVHLLHHLHLLPPLHELAYVHLLRRTRLHCLHLQAQLWLQALPAQ